MSPSGPNYVRRELADFDQYGACAIQFQIMPFFIYPEILVNQNGIPVDLLY